MQPANQATGRSSHARAHLSTTAAILLALSAALLACALISTAAQAVNLPDNRHYEQVTPVHMSGARAEPTFSSEDGEQVFYQATEPFAGSSGGDDVSPYGAERTSTGWQSVQMVPSASKYFYADLVGHGLNDYSPLNLGRGLITLSEPFESEETVFVPTQNPKVYIQEPGSAGGLAPGREVDTTPQSGFDAGVTFNGGVTGYVGASADLSHLFYEPIEGEGAGQLIENYSAGGAWHYRYVGVDGPNNPDGSGNLIDSCETVLGSGQPNILNSGQEKGIAHSTSNAISTDGSTVFFTAPKCVSINFPEITEKPAVNELFARIAGSVTVPISEPSLTHCPYGTFSIFELPVNTCANAQYEGASMDGSKVFFTTTQKEEIPGVSDTTENLYEAQLGGSGVTKLTQLSAGDPGGEARVQGVVRISSDGSHVYFVAQGLLTSAPGPEGQTAQSGADNLYVYSEGATKFIGDLCSGLNLSGSVTDPRCPSSKPDELWSYEATASEKFEGVNVHGAWAVPFGSASSDGHTLVFQSYAQLTSDDTDTARDVYRYNTDTGALVRISVGRDGYDNNGNNDNFDANLPLLSGDLDGADADAAQQASVGGSGAYGQSRPVSNDGSYVFFTTSEALEADDVNDAPDVYEWHDGLVSLISDGQDLGTRLGGNEDDANFFIGASASGRDVFFATPDTLVPGGGEASEAIYDARIGGGFPLANVPPPCKEDSCQGSISPTPSFPTPTSATYSSAEVGAAAPAAPAAKAKPKVKRPKSKPKKKPKAKQHRHPAKRATPHRTANSTGRGI